MTARRGEGSDSATLPPAEAELAAQAAAADVAFCASASAIPVPDEANETAGLVALNES